MNTFEFAVLRILVKRRNPLKLSSLVGGFPDDCEDDVLCAISHLRRLGFLELSEYQPEADVMLARQKRSEAMRIVSCTPAEVTTDMVRAVDPVNNRPNGLPEPQEHPVVASAPPIARSLIRTIETQTRAPAIARRGTSAKRLAVTCALALGIFGILLGGGVPAATSPSIQHIAFTPSGMPVDRVSDHAAVPAGESPDYGNYIYHHGSAKTTYSVIILRDCSNATQAEQTAATFVNILQS